MKQLLLFPLFLGEAKCSAFRRIEITVRFKQAPTKTQQSKLRKMIPGYFEEKPLITGRMLNIGAGKILSQMHQEDLKKMRKTKHQSNYTYYLKGFKNITAFDSDIIDWLEEMNEFCPIQFVFRDESDMGQYRYQGGEWSHVSDSLMSWHEESVDTLETLLNHLDADPYTYKQKGDEKRLFSYCIKALDQNIALRYNFVDLEKYPSLIELVMDESWLETCFRKKDSEKLMKIIQENNTGKYIDILLYEDLGSLFSTLYLNSKSSRSKPVQWCLNLTRELYNIPYVWEICFPFGSSIAPLARLAALNKDTDLLGKISTYTQSDFRAENCCNGLGIEALNLAQKKKFKEAIELFKMALNIPQRKKPLDLDLSTFCNALWVCIKDNTGLPVDSDRNEWFIEKCLPYSSKNPSIYWNIAIIYAEMGAFEKAYQYCLLTKKHDRKNFLLMVKEINTLEALAPFKKYLEKKKKTKMLGFDL